MAQNSTSICPDKLGWTSVIYNNHLNIEEIYNSRPRILFQFSEDTLLGMNVGELEDKAVESNKHWAHVIADNIKKSQFQKRNVYFEYISDAGDEDIAFVVSHIEYLPDGHICQYLMEVCEEDVIGIRREAVRVHADDKYVGQRIEEVLLREKYEKLYNQNNTILESLPVGVELYAIDGTMKYLNLRDCQFFGAERETVLSSTLNLFDNPNLPEEVKDAVRNKRKVRVDFPYYFAKVQNNQYYHTEKVTEVKRIECSGTPILNSKGEAENYVFIVNDITDYYNQSKALDEARCNLALAMEAGNVSAWIYDRRTEAFLYLQGDAVSKRSISMEETLANIHPDDVGMFQGKFQEVMDGLVTKQNWHMRLRDEKLKDSYRYFEYTVVPVQNEIGELFYLAGIKKDVTLDYNQKVELHRMIEELREAKLKAEQSDKLKSAFLANMSHEIRTPLNAIIGFSDLITAVDNPEERDEYINIIKTNNELLLKLISDILDLSKIEAGTVDMTYEEFDFSAHFDEIVVSTQPRIKSGIKFISHNPYSSCIIKSDKNRLMQILINFMTNAIKYTVKGHIEMGYEYIAPNLVLYVTDSGIGIPENKKHKLFHRFEKLDEFAQGTGLGLSICKAIVEAFGGTIGFDTQEGEGSKFWALIPCKAKISYI